MAVADYFHRGALATSQAIEGFNEALFKETLERTPVGISLGPEAAETAAGRLIADLTTRIMARFYPKLAIDAAPGAEELANSLAALALEINPFIEILDSGGTIGVTIGTANNLFDNTIFAGADEWVATIGPEPRPLGNSNNPFGAGAAACLACANIFRFLFAGGADQLDPQTSYSTYHGDAIANAGSLPAVGGTVPKATVLVGAGAIGNAAAWALARAPLDGEIHIVDPEPIELSNLQRYVLADRNHEGQIKVDLLSSAFTGNLRAQPAQQRWEHFVEGTGYDWRYALLALDSAKD
ncbi:MAG: E2 ligase fold family C protein, partial [Acidimicrobiia bacterium]